MRTSTSPAFTGWLSSTSTASTLPGILGAIAVMCASTCASSLDTRSRKWKYAQVPANTASSSMPSRMNLTGERRGSSSGGSAASGLGDFDNSSITSGILIITFSHLDVASRVPDPSGAPTCSSAWISAYRPLLAQPGRAAISALRKTSAHVGQPILAAAGFPAGAPGRAGKRVRKQDCLPHGGGHCAFSFHHHRPPYRRGLADQEHQRDDHQEQTAHHPECVGKRQHEIGRASCRERV